MKLILLRVQQVKGGIQINFLSTQIIYIPSGTN